MMADRATLSRVALGVLLMAALTYGWTTSYPDNVNVSYGLPLRWGTHQLITIAGPVDVWRVDVTALFIDLVVWGALMIVIPIFMERRKAA
ncbi:MAG: hypothetical protein ABIJ47_14065 [Candidatus Bathyarchaeota archaeon]